MTMRLPIISLLIIIKLDFSEAIFVCLKLKKERNKRVFISALLCVTSPHRYVSSRLM